MGFLGGLFKKKSAPPDPAAKAVGEPASAAPPEGTHRVSVLRFENHHPPHVNWREVVLDGRRMRESYGYDHLEKKFGHVSGRSGRLFATAEAAQAEFDRRGRDRGAWKRVEQTVRDVPNSRWAGTPAPAMNPEHEAVLDAARHDALAFDAAARVYADWLVAQHDPRGELAALVQAGKSPDAFLEVNGAAVFGDLDVCLGSAITKLEWQGGLLRGAALKRESIDSDWSLDALTAQFLTLPVARFVTSLRFGLENYEGGNDWGTTLAAVAASPRAAAMQELRFDFYDREESELSWTPYGDLRGHWPRFPALETLVVRAGAGGQLGKVELASLKTFVRESGGLQAGELDELMIASWPNLEHLAIWTGHPDYGGDSSAAQWVSFFRSQYPPKLKHLGLVNCAYVAEAWPLLLASPLLPQLEGLDLSMGVLGDEHLELLMASAPQLSKLKTLDLRENLFTAAGVARLTAALPRAQLDNQREAGRYRYVAVGE